MTLRPLLAVGLAVSLLAAPALATDTPAPAEAATSKPAPTADRLVGTWKVRLDAQQQGEIEVMKLALRDPPPTEEEIAKLPAELREAVQMFAAIREMDPNNDQLKELRAMIDGLESARLKFDGALLVLTLGELKVEGPYTVADASDGTLRIEHTPADGPPQTMKVQFEGDSVIAMANESGKVTRFERQP